LISTNAGTSERTSASAYILISKFMDTVLYRMTNLRFYITVMLKITRPDDVPFKICVLKFN